MSLATSCIALCAPMTAIASVLLFMMAHMLRSGNWTFEVLAAKHGWDTAVKANVCRRGAVMYLFTSSALWVAMFLHAPLQRLWMRMPWQRRQRRAEERLTRAGLLDAEDVAVTEMSGASRRYGGGGVRSGEATELSALDWGKEDMRPSGQAKSVLVNNGSSPLGGRGADPMRGPGGTTSSSPPATAAASLSGRRFPDFMRSLVNGTGSEGDEGANGKVMSRDGPPPAASAAMAFADGASAWVRARGLRSRGQQGGDTSSDLPGSVTIRADFDPGDASPLGTTGHGAYTAAQGYQQQQQQQHANLWSSGGEADSMNDSEFMSDVEMDDHRSTGLRQLRASGWGMRRAGGGARANNGGAQGEGAAPMITSLWPAPATVSRSSSPVSAGRSRGLTGAGPPPAKQRRANTRL